MPVPDIQNGSRTSPLDNPANAAHAWARYRKLMRWMAWLTLAAIIAAVALLYWRHGAVSIHFYIATALGIGLAMLLMAALMGLVFLSNGSGHDDSIGDALNDALDK